jgi:hypothetical protein
MLGFPLGILSAAGAGGVAASDYELIETNILGSNQASITFSNLGDYSSTYKHLQIRYAARSARAAADDQLTIRLNADSTGNYAWHRVLGNGSGVSSTGATSTSTPQISAIPAASATANIFNGAVIDILDPYSTSKNKTIRSLNGFTSSWIALHSTLWMSTASLTSVELIGQNGNLAANSRFSIYGIKG